MTEDNARDLQRTWVCDGCGSATVVGLRRSWVCIGRGSEVVVDMHRSLACDGRGSATVVGLRRSWVLHRSWGCIGRVSSSSEGLRQSLVCVGRGSTSVVGLCEAVTPITKRKEVGAHVDRINRRLVSPLFLFSFTRPLSGAGPPERRGSAAGQTWVGVTGRCPVIEVQNRPTLRIIGRGLGCRR